MKELNWKECSEEEGGGFKAETPIGNYVVYYLDGDIGVLGHWLCELWGGPERQEEGVARTADENLAKEAAVKNYTRIYDAM